MIFQFRREVFLCFRRLSALIWCRAFMHPNSEALNSFEHNIGNCVTFFKRSFHLWSLSKYIQFKNHKNKTYQTNYYFIELIQENRQNGLNFWWPNERERETTERICRLKIRRYVFCGQSFTLSHLLVS